MSGFSWEGDVAQIKATQHGIIAERVLGMERGHCQGLVGGGDSEGGSWFYCQWCGEKREYIKSPPCPKYSFPDFNLVDLMRALGENNIPILVRFDILRTENRFTVIGPEGRITDTDDPLMALCEYVYDRL